MEAIDKKILNQMQKGLKLEASPYQNLAAKLGIGAEELIRRLKSLKKAGYIRRIGGVFRSSALGYQSTLIALELAEEYFYQTAEFINQHPGVTHNYRRNNRLNLWFTLAAASEEEKENFLDQIKKLPGVKKLYQLPKKKLFKLDVFFDLTDEKSKESDQAKARDVIEIDNQDKTSNIDKTDKKEKIEKIDEIDKKIIKAFAADIPLTLNPYQRLAENLDLELEELLECLKNLKENKILKRIAALLHHHDSGYKANGIFVCFFKEDKIEKIGGEISKLEAVSHCYQRFFYPDWPYNFYAMIHAKNKSRLEAEIKKIVEKYKIEEYQILESIEELKKSSMKYFNFDF